MSMCVGESRGELKNFGEIEYLSKCKEKKFAYFRKKLYLFINFDVRKMGGERRVCFLRKKELFLNFKSV